MHAWAEEDIGQPTPNDLIFQLIGISCKNRRKVVQIEIRYFFSSEKAVEGGREVGIDEFSVCFGALVGDVDDWIEGEMVEGAVVPRVDGSVETKPETSLESL